MASSGSGHAEDPGHTHSFERHDRRWLHEGTASRTVEGIPRPDGTGGNRGPAAREIGYIGRGGDAGRKAGSVRVMKELEILKALEALEASGT